MRASEVAEAAGISVQLLRSYQSKGLLPPPVHEGRVAWYGPSHVQRLEWIHDLKSRGYSLKMIHAAVLEDDAAATDAPTGLEPPPAATLRLRDVAQRSGLPPEMLRALEASHLLRPHRIGRAYRYTDADVRAVRQVLTLLGVGMPLEEFLAIADPQLATADQLAEDAVGVWMRQVVERFRSDGSGTAEVGAADGGDGTDDPAADGHDDSNAGRVVASLRIMVAAISGLVAYNVERAVLNAAQAALATDGESAWLDALTREVTRRHADVAA